MESLPLHIHPNGIRYPSDHQPSLMIRVPVVWNGKGIEPNISHMGKGATNLFDHTIAKSGCTNMRALQYPVFPQIWAMLEYHVQVGGEPSGSHDNCFTSIFLRFSGLHVFDCNPYNPTVLYNELFGGCRCDPVSIPPLTAEL